MAKPTPSLPMPKPRVENTVLRDAIQEAAVPATHAGGPTAEAGAERRRKSKVRTQLIGAHLMPDVGKQLRQIALDEDTDVKALLIEAINTLFKSRGKPQIASDPVEK